MSHCWQEQLYQSGGVYQPALGTEHLIMWHDSNSFHSDRFHASECWLHLLNPLINKRSWPFDGRRAVRGLTNQWEKLQRARLGREDTRPAVIWSDLSSFFVVSPLVGTVLCFELVKSVQMRSFLSSPPLHKALIFQRNCVKASLCLVF